MRYDSFGNLLESQGNIVRLPLGFAGGLFDPDTGLTRFVWRDYDAQTGRFTALDPLRERGGDTDWYGYCVDDPVNRVDVWGLAAMERDSQGGVYGECMSDARWWRRQCDQATEFISYALGERRPAKGWGIGKVGEWFCETNEGVQRQRCEDKYGRDWESNGREYPEPPRPGE